MEKGKRLEKELKEKPRQSSKKLKDEHISYKILKIKASSHLGAHVFGPLMERYYKKFTDYNPENSLGEKFYSYNSRMKPSNE